MTPTPYPYYSEAVLSNHSNLFTYQWRHIRAFVENLRIHFFSLGQKIFLSTPRWLPAHILNADTRDGCKTYTLKGSLSFTSFCGFQGRNEGELLFTRVLHFFSYFMNMLVFQSETFTPNLLIYPLILIYSYLGTHRKMPRRCQVQAQNTSPSFLLLHSACVTHAPESRYLSEH